MKTEKEMQQGAQETQPLKEDELGKVSGGGPGTPEWIPYPRPKRSTSSEETWTCSWCNEVMTQGDKQSHLNICSKKPK